MGISAFLLIVAIQFAEGNAQQNSLDCLSCQRMAEAHDCQEVKTCNIGEECFTEMYSTLEGNIFVDLGCKPKIECDAINTFGRRTLSEPQKRKTDGRLTLCEQCCNGPSCNSQACDTYNSTRRICYTCNGEHAVVDSSDCETVRMCNAEEQCYTSKGIANGGYIRSELSCLPNKICATISHQMNVGSLRSSADQNLPVLFGRSINQSGNLSRIGRQEQDFVQTCSECCNHNYCNKRSCQKDSTPVTDSSVDTTTTRVSTTRTATTSKATTSISTLTTTAPPSTMSMSTASAVTLTASVASTTPQPSTICVDCSSSGCSNYSCTGATPYCLNRLVNSADGTKQEMRRCGSELECETDWYNVTALSDICSVYESWQLYALQFSCTYCCVRNYCNRDTNPPRETLYYPQRQRS